MTQGSSDWRVFSRYELSGWTIRPAPKAKAHVYDPWQRYEESWSLLGTKRDVPRDDLPKRAAWPPYLDLAHVFDHPSYDEGAPGDAAAITADGIERILGWCETWGLLGLLPHRAEAVALLPFLDAERQLTRQVRYVRTSHGEWAEHVTHADSAAAPKAGPRVRRRGPREIEPPSVLIYDEELREPSREPLSRTWAQFFPDVARGDADSHAYPRPLSEKFWHEYGEPLRVLHDSARSLTSALHVLAGARFADAERFEVAEKRRFDPDDYLRHRRMGMLGRLNRIVAPVSPMLGLTEEGMPEQRWSSPSLFASLALMALIDLDNKRLRACQHCQELFASADPRQKFCGERHANLARQHTSRAKRTNGSTNGGQT